MGNRIEHRALQDSRSEGFRIGIWQLKCSRSDPWHTELTTTLAFERSSANDHWESVGLSVQRQHIVVVRPTCVPIDHVEELVRQTHLELPFDPMKVCDTAIVHKLQVTAGGLIREMTKIAKSSSP